MKLPGIVEASAITLRDYQAEAIDAVGAKFLAGEWSQLMILPTGSGKTEVFARLSEGTQLRQWLDGYDRSQRRTLILAHRDELLKQAIAKIERANPQLSVGLEKDSARALSTDDVVVASVATLSARKGARLRYFNPAEFRIVVVDEAHHAAADSYQAILRHFDLLPPTSLLPANTAPADRTAAMRSAMHRWWQSYRPDRLLLGVTATPNRGDAVGLEWTFNGVVYEKTLRWMIERSYLARLSGWSVDTNASLDNVRTTAGDFNTADLSEAINTPERNRLILDAWATRARNRKTLGFAVDVQHAKDLADVFSANGIRASWIAGAPYCSDTDRAARRADLSNGQLEAVFNCNLWTEGFDEPGLECAIMARPTKSQALYMQMIGRVTRLFPGKVDGLVLDCVDLSKRHSLVGMGDLFGLPPTFDLEGSDVLTMADRIAKLREQSPDMPLPSGMKASDLDNMIRRIDFWTIPPVPELEGVSRFRWIKEAQGRYRLMIPGREQTGALNSRTSEQIRIAETTLGGFEVRRFHVGGEQFMGVSDSLRDAVRRVERGVMQARPWALNIVSADAAWRNRRASTKQREKLRKIKAPVDVDDPKLTRGQASDLLDRFFALRGGKRKKAS